MLYPQNGDRIVAIESVTSLHHMYTAWDAVPWVHASLLRTASRSVQPVLHQCAQHTQTYGHRNHATCKVCSNNRLHLRDACVMWPKNPNPYFSVSVDWLSPLPILCAASDGVVVPISRGLDPICFSGSGPAHFFRSWVRIGIGPTHLFEMNCLLLRLHPTWHWQKSNIIHWIM